MKRLFCRLSGCCLAALFDVERVTVQGGVKGAADAQHRRTGLGVPALELGEADPSSFARRILHRLHEIVAGDRLAVMALEIEVHAAAKALAAEQRVLHPDQLGAFFVDGLGIEVVDLDVFVRPHRMRHRAGVFGKLVRTQEIDGGDALDRTRTDIARELLVAKHGKPFLQRQLEPVAAGHAIAGPVVEVLMPDHGFNREVVVVGRRLGPRQDELAVEDVEALVLHRAHVEIVGAEDHEGVEVVLAAVMLLVPAHGALERLHCMPAAVKVGRRRVDREPDAAP